jgi:hypothetical protein
MKFTLNVLTLTYIFHDELGQFEFVCFIKAVGSNLIKLSDEEMGF